MRRIIKVGAIDPGFAAIGMGLFDLDTETSQLHLTDLRLFTSKKDPHERYVNIDKFKRAGAAAAAVSGYFKGCASVFAEIPGMAQSADATFGFGIAVGLLGVLSLSVQVEPVQVREVKKALCGSAHATKEEIFEWADKRHPGAPWMRKKNGALYAIDGVNEHLADACLIAEAGVQLPVYRSAMALARAA